MLRGLIESVGFVRPRSYRRRCPAIAPKGGARPFKAPAFDAQRRRGGDLSKRRVESALKRRGVETLGKPYFFIEAATRTVTLHPDPPVHGSLVLANYLDGASAGVGEWHVSPFDEDLSGSLTLLEVQPSRALGDAATAFVKVVSDLGLDCYAREDKNKPIAEIFTKGGRKIGGLLIEVPTDAVVKVCFALRVNERAASTLPLGETSLRIETEREFPRDVIIADFLAVLERLLPRRR